MIKTILAALLLTLIFFSNSHALDCERAWLNSTVHRMCKTEESMILSETERISAMRIHFEKTILDDATKEGKRKELDAALANPKKSPGEQYLINRFIFKNQKLLDDINYAEHKLTASKQEIEDIMDNFYQKYAFYNKLP